MSSFLDTFVGEGIERSVRKAMTGSMEKAGSGGQSGRDIAASGLRSVFSNRGPVMRMAKQMPGFTYPLLGSAIGALLKSGKFLDSILPNSDAPGVREAKYLLQNVAPHIAIGAGEAIGDSVENALDKVRSAPGTPESEQNRELDMIVISRMLPGRLFVPSRDSGGVIRVDKDMVPVVGDPSWRAALDLWKRNQIEKNRTEGQGRNKRNVSVSISFPFEVLPLSVALGQLSDGVVTEDSNVIRDLFKTSSWAAKLSEEAKTVMVALSVTKAHLGNAARDLGEDLFKDLPENEPDPILMELLGRFSDKIQANGRFDLEDYLEVVEFIDDWLGGELTWSSKAKRAYARFKMSRNNGSGFSDAAKTFLAVTWPIYVPVFLMVVLFIAAFWWLVSGALTNTFDYTTQVYAFGRILVGSWLLVILLALCSPIEAMLAPFTDLIGVKRGWFVDYGRKLSAMIAQLGSLLAISALVGAPLWSRLLIIVASLGGYGVMMAFASAGFFGEARLYTVSAAKWMARIVVVTPILVALAMIVLAIIGVDIGSVIPMVTGVGSSLFSQVSDNKVISSILLGVIGLFGAGFILRFVETRKTKEGNTLFVEHKTSLITRLMLTVALVSLVLLPWVEVPKDKFDPMGVKDVSASVTAPASVVVTAPVQQKPIKARKVRHARKKHTKADCAKLPYNLRQSIPACK